MFMRRSRSRCATSDAFTFFLSVLHLHRLRPYLVSSYGLGRFSAVRLAGWLALVHVGVFLVVLQLEQGQGPGQGRLGRLGDLALPWPAAVDVGPLEEVHRP